MQSWCCFVTHAADTPIIADPDCSRQSLQHCPALAGPPGACGPLNGPGFTPSTAVLLPDALQRITAACNRNMSSLGCYSNSFDELIIIITTNITIGTCVPMIS
jgi:hypothetical protein